MAELKTRATGASVDAFLDGIPDEARRSDCRVLASMLARITQAPAVMWGDSIVGFGEYRYKYASGREGDWFLAGFSPRKRNLTIYIMSGFEPLRPLLDKLGKFKLGVGCLYVNRLADIDLPTLEELVRRSMETPRGAG